MKLEYVKGRIGIRWFPKTKIFGRDAFEIVLFPPKGKKWYHCIIPYTVKEERELKNETNN